jgi:hypothetical protein
MSRSQKAKAYQLIYTEDTDRGRDREIRSNRVIGESEKAGIYRGFARMSADKERIARLLTIFL